MDNAIEQLNFKQWYGGQDIRENAWSVKSSRSHFLHKSETYMPLHVVF